MTLKTRSKVKFEVTRGFGLPLSLYVPLVYLCSKCNIKQDIKHFEDNLHSLIRLHVKISNSCQIRIQIWINKISLTFLSLLIRKLHTKFEVNWTVIFRGEDD